MKLNNATDQDFMFFRASEVVNPTLVIGTLLPGFIMAGKKIKSVDYTSIKQLIKEIKTKVKDKTSFDASPQDCSNSMSF